MPDFREQIANIAQDLVNLEVNTIIKPMISGTKMPRARKVLIEIGNEYVVQLDKMGVAVALPDSPQGEKLYGSRQSFEAINNGSRHRVEELTNQSDPLSDIQSSQLFMLIRIRDMSDTIVGMFSAFQSREGHGETYDNLITYRQIESFPPLPLTHEQIIQLRKIWEIGTEEIAMQTVIQLDGDVMTRVIPKYAEGDHSVIHQIHQQGVQTSVAFWKDLISIAKDFLSSLLGTMSSIR